VTLVKNQAFLRKTMASLNWKETLRLVSLKIIGVVLAVVFLVVALILVAYPVVSVVTYRGGDEAKIQSASNHMGKIRTGCRVGGLFDVTLKLDKKYYDHVYCLYPAWPDQLEPTTGDYIQVWPAKKPLLGAPATEGWGWFILGMMFIFGLISLEFCFLSLTLR
jgi:hypothetical protein